MLFKYRIQHEGQKENVGFVVAETSEGLMDLAKENFAGWDVGSNVGVQAVKDYKILDEMQFDCDLSWIHPAFSKI